MSEKPTYEELEQRIQALEKAESERKRTEERLKQGEKKYQKLIEGIPDIIYSYSPLRGGIFYSPQVQSVLGYSSSYLLQNPKLWHDSIHPDDLNRVDTAISDSQDGKPFETEYRIIDAKGKWLCFLDRSIGRTLDTGEIIIEGIATDITERKLAGEALGKNEFKYRSLIDNIPQKIFLKDRDSVYLSCNRSYAEDLAIDPEEISGKDDFMFHPRELAEKYRADDKRIMDSGKTETIEEKYHLIKGGEKWVKTTKVPLSREDGEIYAIFGIFEDITDRKQSEEALEAEQERFFKAFHANPNPMTISRMADGTIIEVNHIWEEAFGYSRAESVGTSSISLGIWVDQEKRQKAIQQLQETTSLRNFEIDLRCKTGEVRHVILSSECLEIGGEQCLITIIQDITAQKRAEQERNKLQAQLANALEMARLGHWEYDVAKDLFTFNDHFYKIFRTTAKEVGGYTISSAEYARLFVHPDDMHVVEEEIRKAIEADDPGFSRQMEHRMLYTDGTVGYISVRFFIVKDDHGRTVKTYGVNQDITEHKKMEAEVLRAQKLESVGLLAGGIAHDFNNILTTIIGNIAMARMQAKPEDEIFELLSEAEAASTRAKALTKQLLTFAKGGMPVKEIASIKDIIKESSSFVLRGSKFRCEFSIAEDLWSAKVDVGQISQVINNIVINANQAMPEGGIIQIVAENLIIEDRLGLPVNPGRYIKISVTDQGLGIAEKHLLNIFDPYFTTKQEGSGLGLATTFSIIKKHNGHITVESQLGVGTTFHIYLPASDKAVPEKEEVVLIKGQGKILVMDDEASLRKMLGRMLEKLGYEPEFAKDGTEAIRMVKEAREAERPYDAVILDLTIPGGMGGKEAINKLLEIDPDVKAIVSSGYSDDPVLSNFQEYGFKGVMPKPFESMSLGKVLHGVLKGEKECSRR